MKSKSFLALFLFVTFFSAIITPVFAATTQQQSPVFAAEQLPAWLAEAGAVTVPDAQLELVQGEFVLSAAAVSVFYYILSTGYYYYPAIYSFLCKMTQQGMGKYEGIQNWIKYYR